jgi:hypothetical protein
MRRLAGFAACLALAAGCSSRSEASGPAACSLLTAADIKTVLGYAVTDGSATTSDSGPPGVTGCDYGAPGHGNGAGVSVWALRRGAQQFFDRMASATAGASSTTIGGYPHQSRLLGGSQDVVLLKGGEYVNVNVVADRLPPGTGLADALGAIVASRL